VLLNFGELGGFRGGLQSGFWLNSSSLTIGRLVRISRN